MTTTNIPTATAATASPRRRFATVAAVGIAGLAVAMAGVSFGNRAGTPVGSVAAASATPGSGSGQLVSYTRGPADLDLTIGTVIETKDKPTGNCVGVNACNQFIADCVGAGGDFVEEHHNPKGQPNLGHCK